MGSNKGKSQYAVKGNCFHSGEAGHWIQDCKLKAIQCSRGCQSTLRLFWSSKQRSFNCRFLKCPNPSFGAFHWVDIPSSINATHEEEGSSSSIFSNGGITSGGNNNIKVTVEEKSKKITFEGQVDVVLDIMKKKFDM